MTDKNQNAKSPIRTAVLVIFGVLLPLITLGFELVVHLCAEAYVDPIPTTWHAGLIALVPIVNIWACVVMARNKLVHFRTFAFFTGMAFAVSLIYTLIFIPLTPLAFLAMMFCGLGFLPLSPMFSLVATAAVASSLPKMTPSSGPRISTGVPFFAGTVAAVSIFLFLEVQSFATYTALEQATNADRAKSRAAVRMLRAFGSHDVLLNACYYGRPSVNDIPRLLFGAYRYTAPDEARKVYYRVTGKPFNSVRKPTVIGLRSNNWIENFDPEIAGESVGGRATGLSLSKSEILGNIYADEAASYLEWTMDFENNSDAQREARTHIALPPGAVVSRVTLWINGVPQEAVFGETGVVRSAYQAVVSRKRDPLLVTASGPDRVMVQCFPVPARDPVKDEPGKMKVRIGITVPFSMQSLDQGNVFLPRLVENNFDVSAGHELRLVSSGALKAPPSLKATGNETFGKISNSDLSDSGLTIACTRVPNNQFWSVAPMSKGQKFVLENFDSVKENSPSRLFVVVDGGKEMQSYVPALTEVLKNIPKRIQSKLIFASDEVSRLSTDQFEQSVNEVARAPFVGGPDNAPFLQEALVESARTPGSAVLWIHGPQPILFTSKDTMLNQVMNLKTNQQLFDFEVKAGPNQLAQFLDDIADYTPIPRQSDFKSDLLNLFKTWDKPQFNSYRIVRKQLDKEPTAPGTKAPEKASQLYALWAFEETQRRITAGDRISAVKLATHSRLVTPVSGAVVLETKEQYKSNGLDPDNPDNNKTQSSTPPGVSFGFGAAPEPHEWGLMIIAGFILLWQVLCKRRLANHRA